MTESANEPHIESPPPNAPRGASGSWGLFVAALLAGVLIGYIGRPYLEARLPERPQAVASSVNQQLPVQPAEVAAVSRTGAPASATSVVTNAVVATTTAPLLITPTPDRSGEMMQYIIANTRHFSGSLNAPVVMIEFSDFQ